MKSPFELLDELNRTDEHARIEAKDSRTGQVGRSVYKTLSAFSNEPGLDGGYLLFGVEREVDTYRPVGVADPDKLQSDLSSMCSEFNVPIRPRVQVEQRDDICLVSAFVPEADVSVKPIYRKPAGLNDGAFRRNGSTDVHCTEEDLQALFADRSGHNYELCPREDTTFDDIDPQALSIYRSALKERNSSRDIAEWSDEKLLQARKCLVDVDGEIHPTVAGLVLFGRRSTLENELWMASRVDYIRIYGVDQASAEEPVKTQSFWGPLVEIVPNIVDAVVADLPRRMSFPPNEIRRTEEAFIPRFVLREAVVNAVMHRDYRHDRAVQIIRYTDRIEIRNPGRSLKPIDELGQVGSNPRNPNIAHIFYQLEFAEAMGSGLHRIKSALSERNLPAPNFESSSRTDRFVATFRFRAGDSEGESRGSEGQSRSSEDQSGGSEDQSGGSEDQSGGSEDQSGGSEDQSGGSEDQSGGSESSLLHQLPPDLQKRIDHLGARAPRAELMELIEALCARRAFRPVELAKLLNRGRDYLTQNYLSPLVEEGRLERAYPQTPGHPQQAYRTTNPGEDGGDG